MQVDTLIRDLLATGQMNEDTIADLNRMLADSAAGSLDPEDADYVAALHARIMGASGAPVASDDEAADQPLEEARLDGLTIAEWRERALKAEDELATLRDQAAAAGE